MCLEDGAALLSNAGNETRNDRLITAADHHLHIQSDAATAEMRSVAERMPELFARLNPELLTKRNGEDALRMLDEAGIRQGVLLSEAYIFTSPFATPGVELQAATLTRAENQFNVDAALNSSGRLTAFVGINPFSDIALEELAYWTGREGVAGVKLHLGNSGFDPRFDEHVDRLGDFVARAAAAGVALLIHARAAGAHDPRDNHRFIDDVLSRARGVVVQIAHGGGGGGAADAAEAMAHYADAVERHAPGVERLVIDLSCVLVLDPEDPESSRHLHAFVRHARRVGLERLLMGSDWPTLCAAREHDALIMSQLPFTLEEWSAIAANRAPYLQ